MSLSNLYSKLQLNPNNKTIYVKLLEFYKDCGKENEAKAFSRLIEKKFNDSKYSDPK